MTAWTVPVAGSCRMQLCRQVASHLTIPGGPSFISHYCDCYMVQAEAMNTLQGG